jgi:hypothetical protein
METPVQQLLDNPEGTSLCLLQQGIRQMGLHEFL